MLMIVTFTLVAKDNQHDEKSATLENTVGNLNDELDEASAAADAPARGRARGPLGGSAIC